MPKFSFADKLTDLCTIKRGSHTSDSRGFRVSTYGGSVDVPCLIQPQTGVKTAYQGGTPIVADAVAYFDRVLDVSNGDVLEHTRNGAALEAESGQDLQIDLEADPISYEIVYFHDIADQGEVFKIFLKLVRD